jgi:predicted aminopeptidase
MAGNFLRWTRLVVSACLLLICVFCAFHHATVTYIIRQASGQADVLFNSVPVSRYIAETDLSKRERENLQILSGIERFSVEELEYKPTGNFRRIYPQKDTTLLWVITATPEYDVEAYEWKFPVVGRVSYKGFFNKKLAVAEYNKLALAGYDVELRPVTAWSTLGWFNDPLLSGMLKRSRSAFCELLLHELFHATLYLKGSVTLNENLANFISREGTRLFFANDTHELSAYSRRNADRIVYGNFIKRQRERLKKHYESTVENKNRYLLKLRLYQEIADSIDELPLSNKARNVSRKSELLAAKNAYFAGYTQYDGMQDSLEEVFNKFYRRDLKKLVHDLKLR